jgi:hypothetical protein
MRTLRGLFFLALGTLALGPGRAWAGLDAPTGLTISVGTDGVMQMVWDPMEADDLMGYSIWKRVEGSATEYTHLMVPVKQGKEVKKLPMTAKARYLFKDAPGARMEYIVIAEYESGRSQPSSSVRTRLARKLEEALSPSTAAAQATPSPVLTPAATAEEAEAKPLSVQAQSFDEAQMAAPANTVLSQSMGTGANRTLLAPAGSIRSNINFAYSQEETEAYGHNSLQELGFYVVNSDGSIDTSVDRTVKGNWTAGFGESKESVPLDVEYGLLPSLEIGAEATYLHVYDIEEKFDIGDQHYVNYANAERLEANGFSNPWLQLRLEPVPQLPLVLTLKGSIPMVSYSRLQAWTDNFWNEQVLFQEPSHQAGLDDSVFRFKIGVEFGQRNINPGPFYALVYMPGASESSPFDSGSGFKIPNRLDFGQETQGEVGYSFPWAFENKPGSASVSMIFRSIDAGDWYFNNQRQTFSPYQSAWFRSFTGVNTTREDQIALALEIGQNVYVKTDFKGNPKFSLDTRGRLEAVLKPDGYAFNLCGGLYY